MNPLTEKEEKFSLMPVPKNAVKVHSKIQQLWMTNFMGYYIVQIHDHPSESTFGLQRSKKIWWLKK